MAETKILIIGIGNSLRGDDGVGYVATERLLALPPRPGVEVFWRHQLTPELADDLAKIDLLILLDANATTPPGQITRQTMEMDPTPFRFLDHAMLPGQLLRLTHDVYGRCPQTILFSVGIHSAEHWEGLSAPVQAAVEPLLRQVQDLVREKMG